MLFGQRLFALETLSSLKIFRDKFLLFRDIYRETYKHRAYQLMQRIEDVTSEYVPVIAAGRDNFSVSMDICMVRLDFNTLRLC